MCKSQIENYCSGLQRSTPVTPCSRALSGFLPRALFNASPFTKRCQFGEVRTEPQFDHRFSSERPNHIHWLGSRPEYPLLVRSKFSRCPPTPQRLATSSLASSLSRYSPSREPSRRSEIQAHFVLLLLGFRTEASWQFVAVNKVTTPMLDRLTKAHNPAGMTERSLPLSLSTKSKQLWVRKPDNPSSPLSTR